MGKIKTTGLQSRMNAAGSCSGFRARILSNIAIRGFSRAAFGGRDLLWSKPMEKQPVRAGPLFATQHMAVDDLANFQRHGIMKRCVRAVVVAVQLRGEPVIYQLQCQADSFEPIGEGQLGCPVHCRLYRARWREPFRRLWWGLRPIYWFERQPWQVKVVLIVCVVGAPILLLATYFGMLRDLTTLVRAIGEAWRGQ